MRCKRKLGTQGGVPVYATFKRDGQTSLPELRITCGQKVLGEWRGSSLGPTNANCRPSRQDVAYWRSLVEELLDA